VKLDKPTERGKGGTITIGSIIQLESSWIGESMMFAEDVGPFSIPSGYVKIAIEHGHL
jgi:hypothetical protein